MRVELARSVRLVNARTIALKNQRSSNLLFLPELVAGFLELRVEELDEIGGEPILEVDVAHLREPWWVVLMVRPDICLLPQHIVEPVNG